MRKTFMWEAVVTRKEIEGNQDIEIMWIFKNNLSNLYRKAVFLFFTKKLLRDIMADSAGPILRSLKVR